MQMFLFFFKLLFSLLLFTTQVVLELEHSSDVIPFLRELVCLVYFLSSSAGRRANCQLDWHFLDLEKLNLQVRNYWFFIGVIGNRTYFCFIEQKSLCRWNFWNRLPMNLHLIQGKLEIQYNWNETRNFMWLCGKGFSVLAWAKHEIKFYLLIFKFPEVIQLQYSKGQL